MSVIEAAVNFNGSSSTILNSFNVTSVVNTGTYYQVNFTTPISNPNYVALCGAGNGALDGSSWMASGPITNNPSVNTFSMWSGTSGVFAGTAFTYCVIYTV